MVRKVLQPWRARPAGNPPAPRSPQLSRLILPPAERWREEERSTLAAVLQAHPRLAQGYQLSTQFRTLLLEREVGGLEPWLQAAETSALPSFQALARSFRQDQDAITAALSTPWSTGQCEGQICRVTLIKRLGYGRAKLDLLCQRLLHRLAVPVQPVQQDHKVHEPAAA
jgi:transposase